MCAPIMNTEYKAGGCRAANSRNPSSRVSYQRMTAGAPRRAERRSALDSALSGLLDLELSMHKALAMSICSTQRIWPAMRLALFVVCWFSLSLVAEADWKDDIGLTKLQETLGDQMPTGQGVFISQVEAQQGGVEGKYFPDPNGSPFNAALDPFGEEPTFVNGSAGEHSNPTISTHATNSVASFFYGDLRGVAPGANTIVIYEVNDYIMTFLNCGSGCGSTAPDAPTFTDPSDGQQKSYVVQNHSWAGTVGSGDARLLRKVDFLVDEYELTTVVGIENGDSDPNTPTLPHPTLDNLLGYSYNAIVVGSSSGLHAIGPTSSLYGPGRTRPTIVSSQDFTVSAATAIVSGAATLMHEELAGTDGALSEPMRAVLLAGATKDEFTDFIDPGTELLDPWDRTASQPLDSILGAGQLNVFNSYLITQGGQFAGSSSESSPTPVESYGWDYNEVTSVTKRYYEIVIPDGSIALDFSVILTWNVEIDPFSFNDETLANLSLTLTNVTDPNSPVVEDQSNSTVDNVEHIYIGEGQAVEYLAPGIYTLEVSGDFTRDYGIAWRTSTLFGDDPNNLTPSADFDENGDVDGSDFLTWQFGSGMLLGASHGDGDADGDGDVDKDDLAIFQTSYGSSALVASVVGVPEPGAMALATIVVLMCVLSHRQKVMRRAI